MRHYFFEIAPGNTVAFFEVPDAQAFAKPAGVPDLEHAAQFDHLSFNLPDEEALHGLRRRLKSFGCGVTGHRRPRHDPLDLLHRSERHRPGGVVLDGRRHRA